MGKKSYVIPEVDIFTMKGFCLLDGFSEKPGEAPVINDGELDANSGSFEEEMVPTKGQDLWDE